VNRSVCSEDTVQQGVFSATFDDKAYGFGTIIHDAHFRTLRSAILLLDPSRPDGSLFGPFQYLRTRRACSAGFDELNFYRPIYKSNLSLSSLPTKDDAYISYPCRPTYCLDFHLHQASTYVHAYRSICRLILVPSSSAVAGKSQCSCQDADGQYDTFTHICCAWQIEHISVWIFNIDHEVCPSSRHVAK